MRRPEGLGHARTERSRSRLAGRVPRGKRGRSSDQPGCDRRVPRGMRGRSSIQKGHAARARDRWVGQFWCGRGAVGPTPGRGLAAPPRRRYGRQPWCTPCLAATWGERRRRPRRRPRRSISHRDRDSSIRKRVTEPIVRARRTFARGGGSGALVTRAHPRSFRTFVRHYACVHAGLL